MLNINLILHNIRSAHNVGAIFRTADCAGVKKIYLTGYTPAPKDKFERVNQTIAKTALGAEKSVEWETEENLPDGEAGIKVQISKLKKAGYQIIALEQSPQSVDYKTINCATSDVAHVALILGSEVAGIAPEIRQICDQIIEIPMHGAKESLNVSVAAGIAIFRLLDL